MTDPAIIDRETSARFWAQTHHRPNVPLDPSNPEDAKMIPIWLAINERVRAEDAAGRLVITYNHPVVVQNLADANVADQMAAEHLRAAAMIRRGHHGWHTRHRVGVEIGDPEGINQQSAAEDPAVKQHVDAADAAAAVSVSKTQDAAAVQPPSVPAQVVAQIAAPTPPPHRGTVHDHVAHLKKRHVAHRHLEHILVREADARFASQYHYRPGQQLDLSNPIDQKMIPLWWDIYNKVEREQRAGRLRVTYDHPVVVQAIQDAHVADQATVQHLDAAATAPDAATAQQHLDAAATAQQIATDRTAEAAAHQPPTADPQLAQQAAQQMPTPPPPTAPASEQLAHQQAQGAAGKAAGAHRGRGRDRGRGHRGMGQHRGTAPGAGQPSIQPQAPGGQTADPSAPPPSSPGDGSASPGAGTTGDTSGTPGGTPDGSGAGDQPTEGGGHHLKAILIIGGIVGAGALLARWIQAEVKASRDPKVQDAHRWLKSQSAPRPRNVEKTTIVRPLPLLAPA